MKANQAERPVRALRKTLRFSYSGYYDWLERPACAQALANVLLLQQIRQAHVVSDADLVQRELTATGINELWVADMTYMPTWAGFVYLSVVRDVYSRKVVGWAFDQQQTADLVIQALNMALITRKPQGVNHQSDQGSQYTSVDFGKLCTEMGVRPSMGSVGDAYDNAMTESFFASLVCELIDRRN